MTTTEVVSLPLVAGSDIGDPDNQSSAVLKECGDVIMQQDGVQQMQFGMHVETPSTLQLFINWNSKKDHENFMAADEYGPFFKKFGTIISDTISMVHADFKPDGGLASALSAPVTEVATFYFDGGPPDNAIDGVKKALDALKAEGHNLLGWAYGTTYEEIERDGVKGKGTVLAIGWESVEAHMEARKGEAFKENIASLRNGAKAIEMHHVAFMNFQA